MLSKSLLISLVILSLSGSVLAQCKEDFSVKVIDSGLGKSDGKIEVSVAIASNSNFTFSVFKISGAVEVGDRKVADRESKIVFDELAPGDYIIRVEWGANCREDLGGVDGISVNERQS